MYSDKIVKIVEDISSLNLLEVADLNSLLKSRLNISDAPVMMAGAGAAAPVAAVVEVSRVTDLALAVINKTQETWV